MFVHRKSKGPSVKIMLFNDNGPRQMGSPTREFVAAPSYYALEVVPFNLSVPPKSRSVTETDNARSQELSITS